MPTCGMKFALCAAVEDRKVISAARRAVVATVRPVMVTSARAVGVMVRRETAIVAARPMVSAADRQMVNAAARRRVVRAQGQKDEAVRRDRHAMANAAPKADVARHRANAAKAMVNGLADRRSRMLPRRMPEST